MMDVGEDVVLRSIVKVVVADLADERLSQALSKVEVLRLDPGHHGLEIVRQSWTIGVGSSWEDRLSVCLSMY